MIQESLKKSIALVPWKWRGRIKRLPLVAPLQRWLLARFLEGREFVHTVDAGPARGLNYPVRLPDDKGIWTGTYELEFSQLLAQAVKPGEAALDIGGWHGFFGGVMALAGASRVFIFEPMPANCAQIKKMISLNPNLPLELVEAAVSDAEGMIDFVLMGESSMGKLANSSFQADNQTAQRIQVRTVALDELLTAGKINAPAMMKIDVEGAELQVLKGARQLLAAGRPALFIEIHSRQLGRECRDFLVALGYEIEVLEPGEPEVCHFVAKAKI